MLRYRIAPPALSNPDEQEYTGNTDTWVDSVNFRNGVSAFSADRGVRVVTDDGYWGRIKHVFKQFEVHEEF